MVRWLISVALHLAGNAIGLIVAALVLDDMSLDGAAFIIALVIFTIVEALALPFLQKQTLKNGSALSGGVALVSTFIALVVTDLISDGLSISGGVTWVLATIIVWLCSMLAGLILPAIFLRNRVEARRS